MSEGPPSDDVSEEERAKWRPKANPWAIAIVVTLAAFMEVLDTTIVNVALPHVAGSLSSGQDESTWTLTSYLVANSIVLPISGWFGKVLGRKRYFLICIGMFTVCSLFCGLATSLWQLILARLFQGFFGGGLQPNQQSIVLDTFEPAMRGAAFGVSAIAIVVAPVLGPTLGGWITDNYSWRWIFFINVPVGIVTWLLVANLVEDPPWAKAQAARVGIDYIGLGLIAVGLGCLQIMLDRGEQDDWLSSPFICAMAVLALLGIVGAACWLVSVRNPVVDLRALADRNLAIGCATIFAMALVLYASAVLLPQLSQQQLGYTATLSGLLLSPGAILTILGIAVVGRIMPHVQIRYLVVVGFLALGASLFWSSGINPQIDFRTLVLMRCAQSASLALLFVPISTVTFATIDKSLNADATSLFTMFRNIAGSVGISISTALVTSRTQIRQAHLAVHLSPQEQPYLDTLNQYAATLKGQGTAAVDAMSTAMGIVYRNLMTQSAVLAYIDVFMLSAIMCFLVAPLALLFSPMKGGGGGRGAME